MRALRLAAIHHLAQLRTHLLGRARVCRDASQVAAQARHFQRIQSQADFVCQHANRVAFVGRIRFAASFGSADDGPRHLAAHGYRKRHVAREARSADGTMSTVGDVGYVDEDGYVYLTDRRTFMIISGGVNIYPQECENLLITHPAVADAAVFGVPNADLGEEFKAVVQPMPGISPTAAFAEELIAFCRQRLAHIKCPRSIDFEEELPRLPTGKLYKRLLRDRYWGNKTSRIV